MTRPKRILLYGFGPYRQFRQNITAKIVRTLPPATGLKRVVFPVRFNRRQFVEALERHKPDVVLGLGQSSRRTMEIETRAANRRRTDKKARARAIRKRGARFLPTTLDLKLGRDVKRSNNAGDYVCNFSMYVILEHIQRTGASIRFGFVHIPHHVAPLDAAHVVAGSLKRLGVRTG